MMAKQKLLDILEEIEDLQQKVFQLVKEQRHKESADELEKILCRFQKLLLTEWQYDIKVKEKLAKLKTLFSVLKRYYELMFIISSEANRISGDYMKPGTLVRKVS